MVTPELPEFPPDAQRIVERWDPDGLRAWRSRTATPGTVRVVAVRGIDRAPVLDALAEFGPAFGPGPAAVAVVVFDGASVLGRDELAALDAAAADVEHVVLVLSGGGEPGRSAVRERDLALLRAHAPRFAGRPLVDPAGAAPPVRALLAEDPVALAARNDRRAAHSLVERTCRRITATARTLRDGPDTDTLRTRRARLAAQRDGGRAERLAQLRADVQRARVDLVHDAGNRIRATAVAARSEIDRAGRRDLAAIPARVTALAEQAAADLDEGLARRVAEIAARAGVPGPATPSAAPAPRPDAPDARHRGVEDRLMVLVGASAGVGLGRLAVAPISMLPALDIASIPITLTLGAGAAWWIARARRLVADRAHLRQWASDTAAHLRAQLEQRVLGRILEVEGDVSAQVIADCRAASLEIDEQLAALDGEARRAATERGGRLAACDRDRAALTAVLDALANAMEPSPAGARPTG
ncbi:hypothetical protein [Rhodococcus sp. SGAir0479]|uniref:hypothetical protein n=1 Tax=Rhodococcus sp. SGAir0479 TaxID=2567884 RepID=UPI0010CD2330|nr:hypothetical protein [Rhodococcus sp. SGAir0479]QCQ92612.1 hypothetical protein E7742_16230 [Rhodococcus sp. SGAir0479]